MALSSLQTIFREIYGEIPFQISKLIIKTVVWSTFIWREETDNRVKNMRDL